MLNLVLEGLLVHPKITVPLKKKQKKTVNNFSCMEGMLILCKVTLNFYTI